MTNEGMKPIACDTVGGATRSPHHPGPTTGASADDTGTLAAAPGIEPTNRNGAVVASPTLVMPTAGQTLVLGEIEVTAFPVDGGAPFYRIAKA